MEVDPQEHDPKLRRIINTAYRQACRDVGPLANKMGGCHAIWARQQEILRKQYGITWRTPAELNPGCCFD